MDKQRIPVIKLDERQKNEVINFVRGLMDEITKYMTSAFKISHLEYQVDKETFWRNLFIKEGTGRYHAETKRPENDQPILTTGRDGNPDSCPEDPYKQLDFQVCCKYLRFGGTRIISYNEEEDPQYAVDSYKVFDFFGISYSNKNDDHRANGGADNPYQDTLRDCMSIRNKYMHMDEKSFVAITLDQINRNISRLEDLTYPFAQKHRGWEQKAGLECSIRKFWEQKKKEFKEKFGALPVSLTEIGYEIFLPDADELIDEQRSTLSWLKRAQDAGAENVEERYYAEERAEEKAREELERTRARAEAGDAEAQRILGNYYYEGQDVMSDFTEAVKWFRLAAEQGDSVAQFHLGNCYYNGDGVTEDFAEAVKWYRLAAEQGYAGAQSNLGNCYYNGDGVMQDFAEAVKWYRLAAEQGIVHLQYVLGNCYLNGKGVKRDRLLAYQWFSKAVENGNIDARRILAKEFPHGAPPGPGAEKTRRRGREETEYKQSEAVPRKTESETVERRGLRKAIVLIAVALALVLLLWLIAVSSVGSFR